MTQTLNLDTQAHRSRVLDAWLRVRPSNRMAAFDPELDTVTRALGEITYVLRPGFFTGLGIWGMAGDQFSVVIRNKPGPPQSQ